MRKIDIINKIGSEYLTANIETGEYSYVKEAGGKDKLESLLGHAVRHQFADARFEQDDFVIILETKQNFVESDTEQLADYLEEERILHHGMKVICILANTNNDKIRVYKSFVKASALLPEETVIDTFEHYKSLFMANTANNKELVLKNTYDLNESLHKLDIDEKLRSQFVGTTLLYIKDVIKRKGIGRMEDEARKTLNEYWSGLKPNQIIAGIKDTLDELLDGSDNKTKKIELLQKNVLGDQKVKKLTIANWISILDDITFNIYRFINTDSSEGQDILNLFFIAFNKYTGKADKNQAFTPDHITDFMCRVTGVDRTKKVLDATCGSGSFLVQAMVKELADCKRGTDSAKAAELMDNVKKYNIYGIEIEEKAYGLSTTNMLIHGDGNSNIRFGSIFDSKDFIETADPDIILMNPPYNAKPIGIPAVYKAEWGNSANGKEDPTKGIVFVQYLADIVKEMNNKKESQGINPKYVKLAVLLPLQCAIGSSKILKNAKTMLLENNTLEAVFSLPNEMFYPGASVCACCMVFTLGKPHFDAEGQASSTFFGYYKEDGFKKKKNLGRVEQFDEIGESIWKKTENEWIQMFRDKSVVDGKSAMAVVSGSDEWLCEAYMKTDYSTLSDADFQQTINNYLAYLVKEGHVYES